MEKRYRTRYIALCILSTIFFLPGNDLCFAEDISALKDAFTQGKFSGTIGNYTEFVNKKADNSDTAWSTGYLTLKYETLDWNHVKLGARVFAHGKLYDERSDSVSSPPYKNDIETQLTLPELYLTYEFLNTSAVTAGRWNHKKVSHIDDAQSEGAYIRFAEIKNFEMTAGVMRRFAEIDYDDSEDFGRKNDAQDLDSESTYGAGASPYLIFLESQYKPTDLLTINPFYMTQQDYADVIGIDTGIKTEWKKHGLKYGGNLIYERVNAEAAGSDNADIVVIQPFVKKGPWELKCSYSKFDDGDALNHPGWLADSFNLVDQDNAKNNAGAEVVESLIKYRWDKVWASYAYATATYAASSSEGDGYSDHEFQIGYQITDSLDVNLRYFIVAFDNIYDKDYNKVETRLRFKF